MSERLTGRDRSGRVPRASRQHAFYQSPADWDVPGPVVDILPPTTEPPHTDNPTTDDITRGAGY